MSAKARSRANSRLALLSGATMVISSLLLVSMASADDDKVGEFTVSLEQATAIALEQVPGTILGAEVESEDNATIWEIEVRDADGVVYEVELDANSGEVLEVEKDD